MAQVRGGGGGLPVLMQIDVQAAAMANRSRSAERQHRTERSVCIMIRILLNLSVWISIPTHSETAPLREPAFGHVNRFHAPVMLITGTVVGRTRSRDQLSAGTER
jgi:hypothetical protein